MTLNEFILNANLNRAPSSFSTRWQWRPIGTSSDTSDHAARAGVGRGGGEEMPCRHSSSDTCLALQSPQAAKFSSCSADEVGSPR